MSLTQSALSFGSAGPSSDSLAAPAFPTTSASTSNLKRSNSVLTIGDVALDLTEPIPQDMVTTETVEGLRKRILVLQGELNASKERNKKARLAIASKEKSSSAVASGSNSGPATKMDEKKQKAQLKKLFTALAKSHQS